MTKFLAAVLAGLVYLLTAVLPRWKRLAVRARLSDRLRLVETVRVAGRDIRLVVPDRHSLYWIRHAATAEPDTNAWIATFHPGDVVFDVGANVGFYALLAAANGAGKVYAFEPNPFSFAALARNVFENRAEVVVVPICAAVGDRSGLVTFGLSSLDAGTVGNEVAGSGAPPAHRVTQPVFGLDEFVHMMKVERVDHLKIDVDGLEPLILKGAAGVLAGLRSLVVEINAANQGDQESMLAMIRAAGLVEVPPPVAGQGQNRFFARV